MTLFWFLQQLSVPLSQCWSKSELRNMASSSVSFWILLITVCSTDGFVYFQTYWCDFNSTELNDIEYTASYYYQKLEFTRFSSSLGKYVGYTDYGVKNAEAWNNNPAYLNQARAQKETYCQPNIVIDYSNILSKSAKPYVHLYSTTPPSGRHPSMLVCSIYKFYPKYIKVSWFRDGKEVTSDVTSTEEMENGDWYYQIHSHLEYTPRSGEKISCVVEHASLKDPLRTDWDPSMPESERNKIAIGASGLVLGLVLSLAGFIYYKRKARGRTLVPTTN
ncbi:H-2 class II histocompatibility antigen, E-S beta chain-like [Acanthochromis polyacanthus]|uniref:H-2 class II histocompatibility antigen, E-S beta chain-like n=1 Tax=Acanthochromis polyacanthus TaxID=80966 RepID=UPI002234830D|nr:H-2 class II histocompatibility antigen, E-S beta chain-like [Acanthochromis polyacanthus]